MSTKPLTVKFCTLTKGNESIRVNDTLTNDNTEPLEFIKNESTKEVKWDNSSGQIYVQNNTTMYFRVWQNTVTPIRIVKFLKKWTYECKRMKVNEDGVDDSYPCHTSVIDRSNNIRRFTLLHFEKDQLQFYIIYYNKGIDFIYKNITRWYYEYMFLNLLLSAAENKNETVTETTDGNNIINECIQKIIKDGNCNYLLGKNVDGKSFEDMEKEREKNWDEVNELAQQLKDIQGGTQGGTQPRRIQTSRRNTQKHIHPTSKNYSRRRIRNHV